MTYSQLRRLLSGIAVVLLISSAAIAQQRTGTVKTLTLKSKVLGEDRVILVRTPVGAAGLTIAAGSGARRSGVAPLETPVHPIS